jgi:hypothetical protein
LTAAARGALPEGRSGGRDGRFRSNKGMGGGCSRAGGVPTLVGGVEQSLLFEQGAGHRQQAVGDGAQGAAVAVAALAQRGITAAAERVVLGCQARPMIERVREPLIAGRRSNPASPKTDRIPSIKLTVRSPCARPRARRLRKSKTVAGRQGRALADRAADPVCEKRADPHGCSDRGHSGEHQGMGLDDAGAGLRGRTTTASVAVTGAGAPFSFRSIDLYSSTTPIR